MNTSVPVLFLGLDQTGRLKSPGNSSTAAPLKLAALYRSNQGLKLSLVRIPSLSKRSLVGVFPQIGSRGAPVRVILLVDTVFGLPEGSRLGAEEGFDPDAHFLRAARSEGFGLAAAERFFSEYIAERKIQKPFPKRRAEVLANANSLFQTRPFQKNIQTGSYRIWKDLGQSLLEDGKWFAVWPFQSAEQGRVEIYEGFPSFYAREFLGLKSRSGEILAEELGRLRREFSWEISDSDLDWIRKDADWADSALLAVMAYAFTQNGVLGVNPQTRFISPSQLRFEGWITGIKCEKGSP